MRVAVTRLADDQLREADAAFHRLESRSLAFYLDYALSNYRDPVNDMSLADALKLHLAVREADEKLRHISHRRPPNMGFLYRKQLAGSPRRDQRRVQRVTGRGAQPDHVVMQSVDFLRPRWAERGHWRINVHACRPVVSRNSTVSLCTACREHPVRRAPMDIKQMFFSEITIYRHEGGRDQLTRLIFRPQQIEN